MLVSMIQNIDIKKEDVFQAMIYLEQLHYSSV